MYNEDNFYSPIGDKLTIIELIVYFADDENKAIKNAKLVHAPVDWNMWYISKHLEHKKGT